MVYLYLICVFQKSLPFQEVEISSKISIEIYNMYLNELIFCDHNAPVIRMVCDTIECKLEQRWASLRWWREILESIESAVSSISTYPLLYLRLTVSKELYTAWENAHARRIKTIIRNEVKNENIETRSEKIYYKKIYPMISTYIFDIIFKNSSL